MKRVLLLLFVASTFVCLERVGVAQLPPTVNRISAVDSAVDVPDFFVNDLFVESFKPEFATAIAPRRKSFFFTIDELFNTRPFYVYLWARVDSRETFQILLNL